MKHPPTLPLAGLSVLSGKNSAGKSSLTQSLLLIAQSLRDDIVLNGPLVRLGSAEDVINESAENIQFQWETTRPQLRSGGRRAKEALSIQISLSKPRMRDKHLGTALVISELHVHRGETLVLHASDSRVEAATLDRNNPNRVWGDSLLRVHSIEGKQAPARTFVAFSGLYPSFLLYKKEKRALARRMYSVFKGFVEAEERAAAWIAREFVFSLDSLVSASSERRGEPESTQEEDVTKLLQVIAGIEEGAESVPQEEELADIFGRLSNAIAANDIVAMPLSSRTFYSFGYRGLDQADDLIIPGAHISAWQDVAAGFRELRDLARRVSYIGPLREEPQVLSPTGGRTGSVPAGIKGEYTADLLYRSREDLTTYIDPEGVERSDLLLDAVGVWAARLGVGESVLVVDEGKLGRGIRVNIDGKERDLTTIGVGVSQLLPVITVVLAASKNSIVILEQPELHLHPAIQSRLAEFFSSARPDLAIIVETHSEYLITRLRRLNVSRDLGMTEVSFLFAHAGDGGSTIEPLGIDSLGDIDEWPEGFFDTQEIEERLLLGALTARARRER